MCVRWEMIDSSHCWTHLEQDMIDSLCHTDDEENLENIQF